MCCLIVRLRLGKKYLHIDAYIAPDAQFESRVARIQRGNANGMTDAEKSACEKLRAPATTMGNEVPCAAMSVVEHIALRKRRRWMNRRSMLICDFILGSWLQR